MGEDPAQREEEIATIRLALDIGVTPIDTAELRREDDRLPKLLNEALQGRRSEAFLVTRLSPYDGSRFGTVAACERSLEQLGTSYLDMLLLDGRGPFPLLQTVEEMMALRAAGKIRHFGVSNFSVTDMRQLCRVSGGSDAETDEIAYDLSARRVELGLLPWLRQHRIPAMVQAPLDESRLSRDSKLKAFAKSAGMTPAEVALAWLLAKPDIIAIANVHDRKQLRDIVRASERTLTPAQLAELDFLFPAPREHTVSIGTE